MQIHHNSALETITSKSGRPLFDDSKQYWYAELPNHGVKVPSLGVKIRVFLELGGSDARQGELITCLVT